MTTSHPICYVEIPTTDVAASATFYEGVFGWTVEREEGYGEFTFPAFGTDGGPDAMRMAGGFDTSRRPHAGEEGPMLYLACADIDAKLAEVEAAAGARVKEKTEIGGGHGFYGLFRDPSGNLLGLWSRS